MRQPNDIVCLTVAEFEKILDDALTKSSNKVIAGIERLKETKEKLRNALLNAGFEIPECLTLEEWIPIIEGKVQS